MRCPAVSSLAGIKDVAPVPDASNLSSEHLQSRRVAFIVGRIDGQERRLSTLLVGRQIIVTRCVKLIDQVISIHLSHLRQTLLDHAVRARGWRHMEERLIAAAREPRLRSALLSREVGAAGSVRGFFVAISKKARATGTLRGCRV